MQTMKYLFSNLQLFIDYKVVWDYEIRLFSKYESVDTFLNNC